jgi:hypothetical protein
MTSIPTSIISVGWIGTKTGETAFAPSSLTGELIGLMLRGVGKTRTANVVSEHANPTISIPATRNAGGAISL